MPANAPRIVQFPSNRARASRTQAGRQLSEQRRPWLRTVILLCSTVFVLLAGTQLVRQEMRMHELTQSYQQLLAKQEALQATNESMQQQIEDLQNDPEYLEQKAREMGMVKPNDTIYLPVDSSR